MKLEDLIKPLRDMTDEELHERIRAARHNKNRVKPAAVQKAKKETQRKSVNKLTDISKRVDSMTQEEKLRMLEQLKSQMGV